MSELVPLKITVMKSQRDLKLKTIEYIDQCEVRLANMKEEAHRMYLEKKAEYERILSGDIMMIKKFTLMKKLLKRKLQLLQKHYRQKKLIKYFMTIIIKRQLIVRLTYTKHQYINQVKQQNVAGLQEKLNSAIQMYNQVVTCKINTLVKAVNVTTGEYTMFLKKKQLYYKLLSTKYQIIAMKRVYIYYQMLKYKKSRYNQQAQKKKVLLSHILNEFQFMKNTKKYNPQMHKLALEVVLAQYKRIQQALPKQKYALYVVKYSQLLKLQDYKKNLNDINRDIQQIQIPAKPQLSKEETLYQKEAELQRLKQYKSQLIQVIQTICLHVQKYDICETNKQRIIQRVEKIYTLKACTLMKYNGRIMDLKAYELNKVSRMHRLKQFQRTGDQKLLVLQQMDNKLDQQSILRQIQLKICLGYQKCNRIQQQKIVIKETKKLKLHYKLLVIKQTVYQFMLLLMKYKQQFEDKNREECLTFALQHDKIKYIQSWISLLYIKCQKSQEFNKIVVKIDDAPNSKKFKVPIVHQPLPEQKEDSQPDQQINYALVPRIDSKMNTLKFLSPLIDVSVLSSENVIQAEKFATEPLNRVDSIQNNLKYTAQTAEKIDNNSQQLDQDLVLVGNGPEEQSISQLSSNSMINTLQQNGQHSTLIETKQQAGSLQSRSGLSGDNFKNSDFDDGYQASSSTSFARGSSSSNISEGEDVSEI